MPLGCAAAEILAHCWWDSKMVQSPLKHRACWFLIKLNVLSPYGSMSSLEDLLNHQLKSYNIYENTHTQMFIASLSTFQRKLK